MRRSNGVASLALMEAAGEAVAEAVHSAGRMGGSLCCAGPATMAATASSPRASSKRWAMTWAWRLLGKREALKGDAAVMAERWDGLVAPLSPASSTRPMWWWMRCSAPAWRGRSTARRKETVAALNRSGLPVVAVDVPSGLHGDLAQPLGSECVEADITVTFFRKKPAHVLMPGRHFCGDVIVADIGIPEEALETIRPRMFENGPELWGDDYPWPDPMGHKYARGHARGRQRAGPCHRRGPAGGPWRRCASAPGWSVSPARPMR